jgi:hypothetical protein
VWKGNATLLLETLQYGLSDENVKKLPKTASILSGKLRRLGPSLQKSGISVQRVGRDGKKNTKQWELSVIKKEKKVVRVL